MKLVDLLVSQLEEEAPRTRRALEQYPSGHDDWKPHDKSMPFGRLAMLVARMPTWFPLILKQDDLNLAGGNVDQTPLRTGEELVRAHDDGVAAAHQAFSTVTDDYLTNTKWRLLMGDKVVMEQPRYIVVRDTFMHLSHHRGQLTVYLRLQNAPVPSIYGPSADDQRFL